MRELRAVGGATVPIPDPDHVIHLQFRRFAGCPICNLHLRSFVRRHAEIETAGIREVVVFHSSERELAEYELPFAVIADPGKKLYVEYGVQAGPRALLNPGAWGSIIRGVASALRHRDRLPEARQPGGRLGLPADFLIWRDKKISHYGRHAADHWEVDEVLGLARRIVSGDQAGGKEILR